MAIKPAGKYTLYLDESGTAEFTDTRKPNSKHFIITAIAVDDAEDRKMSGYFEYLKRRHKLNAGTPFHSYSIYEDRGDDRYLTPAQARSLNDSLIEFFKLTPVRFMVFCINKNECRKYLNIRKGLTGKDFRENDASFVNSIIYTICSANAFRWFSDKVLNSKSKGSIIAESRDRSDKNLIDAFLDCKDEGMYIRAKKSENRRVCDRELKKIAREMRKRVTGLKFETKIGECPGLEIADLISFLTFLSLERRLNEFQNKNLIRLWRVVKSAMIGKEPYVIKDEKFVESLARNRVHKISRFANKTRKPLDTL